MLPILDKSAKKEYDLLKLLDEEDRWWTRAELAARTGISERTLHKYIQNLAQHLSHWPQEEIRIETGSNLGTHLHRSGTFNIHLVYSDYAESSIVFAFFNAVFSKRVNSIVDFCLKNYISSASLYRKLLPMRKALQLFNIDLDVASLTMNGSESQLRYFYYTLYLEIYRGCSWPFSAFSQQRIMNDIQYLCDDFHCQISTNDREQFAFWIAVILTRIRNGHPTAAGSFDFIASENPVYPKFRGKIGRIFTNFSLPQYETECQFLFFILHSFPFFEAMHDRWFDAITKNTNVRNCVPLQATDIFLQDFASLFQVDYIQISKELRLKLNRLHFHAALLRGSSDLLERYPFLKNFDDTYPTFAQKFHGFYQKLLTSEGRRCFIDMDYLFPRYLLLCSQYFHLADHEQPIGVRLFTDYGPIYENRIKTEIRGRFYDDFNLQFVHEAVQDYDIMITNIPRIKEAPHKLVMNVHEAFNSREWSELERLLKTARAHKTAK